MQLNGLGLFHLELAFISCTKVNCLLLDLTQIRNPWLVELRMQRKYIGSIAHYIILHDGISEKYDKSTAYSLNLHGMLQALGRVDILLGI